MSNAADARELRALIQKHLAHKSNGVIAGQNKQAERYYDILVGDRHFVYVRAYVDLSNAVSDCYLTLVDGYDRAAAHMQIVGDVVDFRMDSGRKYAEVIKLMKERLSGGMIMPKLRTPYGYVEDGVVTAIWFSEFYEKKVRGALHAAVAYFALQGHELPALPFFSGKLTPAEYVRTHWELMRKGKIVELRDRVVGHPGTLWFKSSKTVWPHLIFDKQDAARNPRIVGNTPYLFCLAGEARDSRRTKERVMEYFKYKLLPQNLTEFFKAH